MSMALHSLYRRVVSLAGWQRYGLAFVLGFLTASSMAPYYALPFLITGFSGLVWLMDGAAAHERRARVAFWTGWWFAFGYFLLSLYWMALSFMVHAVSAAHLVALAVMGFAGVAGLAGFIACFYGLALVVAMRFWRPGWRRVLVLVFCWSLAEFARGHLFTGLPWNLTGQALAGMAVLSQLAAWIGPYGLGLIVMVIAALPALAVSPAGAQEEGMGLDIRPLAASGAGIAGILLFGFIRLGLGEVSYVEGVRVQIVQPDIVQQDKINPDKFVDNFLTNLTLTGESGDDARGSAEQLYTIWPENASYQYFSFDEGALEMLGEAMPEDGILLTGGVRVERPAPDEYRYFNSFHVVTDRPLPGSGAAIDSLESGAGWSIATSYDKHHLAPFGEYLPLAGVLEALGVGRVVPLSAPFTPGKGPQTIDLGRTRVSPIICYETIFPGRIYPRGERPDWLVTITNDAWFGDSAGPRQHLDMARLRSIESGLPMARSANTGISAMIDPYGRVTHSLGLYERGTITARLPAAISPTFYHIGSEILYFLLLVIIAVLVITSSNAITSRRMGV